MNTPSRIAGDGASLPTALPITKAPSESGPTTWGRDGNGLGNRAAVGDPSLYPALTYLGEPDRRFDSFDSLVAYYKAMAAREADVRQPLWKVRPEVVEREAGLVNGRAVQFTKHGEQQVASALKIPFEYMDRCTPELRVANYGEHWKALAQGDKTDRLFRIRDGRLRAFLSGRYTPISNLEVADGVQKATGITRGMVLHRAWTSNAAMHVFVYDPELSMPSPQPTGPDDRIFLGMHFWNSEIGTASMGYDLMLFRTLCENYNVWGYDSLHRDRVIHVSFDNLRRALTNMKWLTESLRERVAEAEQVAAQAAAEVMLDGSDKPEKLVAAMRKVGFSEEMAESAIRQARTEFGAAVTRWSLVQGLTWLSQKQNVDDRVHVDKLAGKVLAGALLK